MVSPEKFVSTAVVFVLLLFLFSVTSSAKDPQNYYNFSIFNSSQQLFSELGDASINKEALQLTPDTSNGAFNLSNKSGRVMILEPFKLWEESSATSSPSQNMSSKNSSANLDSVASFNSTFLINIYKLRNQSVGEGFAFLIAPDLNMPSASFGQWLGLTNATLDGNSSNKIVAIELDTLKQDFDPDGNHMGLNINSVKSNKTVPLSEFGIEIAPDNPKNYSVWVQYNGKAKLMEVYMADEGLPKPRSPILSEKINLKDYVNQYSYMGFSASTGTLTQLNCVLRWELSVEALPRKRDLKLWKMVVGVVGLALFGVVVVGMVYYLNKRRVVKNPKILGALKSLPGMSREFRFRDLKKATNNFSEKMKLGQGGYGVVYKGVLPQENIEVAVKKFSRDNKKGINDFLDELTIINRLRHKHLVRLLGWCHKKGLLLLVYDYMPNGSLDNHLFGGPERILSWEHRYNIIAGVASALHYLHDEFDQRVIHRDLKASNILLDSSFNARLGDFGLARALDNEKTSYAEVEGVPGTMGYVAPECFHMGKATTESDVFGFGAVVLEVVCGKHPLNSSKIADFHFLVDWVWTLYREGRILDAVDERLVDNYDAQQAERLLLLGLACSHPIAAQRPKTPIIIQVISGSVPPPDTPFIKPAFVWPATGFTIDIESLVTDNGYTASMASSNDGSQESQWTLRCERRETYVRYSDISLP
ncbi:probable L-type lectin-domain containing receptor kinase S.5 [Macadamia integrifolia]|uniref:probable L-type lectin-domain containing receptor kinase S.5 n=1 Tax=Macadamia integrifolia TaxID=60698 RepID=UPI001C4F0213|nr:probable L-type lectin-domain containing receptor kinase S.5 [Macadamia integrifolia]